MARTSIDLNSDLGESFGAFQIGYDAELFPLISSANVACGFHGGDPRVIARTVTLAKEHGVAVGAHPGFPDLVGFGRRVIAATVDEIRTDTLYQLGALDAFCRAGGVPMRYVKAHGALSNVAMKDASVARAIAEAVAAFDNRLSLMVLPGTELQTAAESVGLPAIMEAYADRAYHSDGTLVSRREPGAMITDPETAAARMLRLVTEGKVTTIEGSELEVEVESICTHSDTPGAVEIVRAMRRRFDEAGIAVRLVIHGD
jgi:5-oxoprolinase (ATP-hydrolysing) subunit A